MQFRRTGVDFGAFWPPIRAKTDRRGLMVPSKLVAEFVDRWCSFLHSSVIGFLTSPARRSAVIVKKFVEEWGPEIRVKRSWIFLKNRSSNFSKKFSAIVESMMNG